MPNNSFSAALRGFPENDLPAGMFGLPPGRRRQTPRVVGGAVNTTGGAATISLTPPVGTHQDCLIIAAMACRNSVASVPSGFNEVCFRVGAGDTTSGLAIFWKMATPTETAASWSFGSSNSQNKYVVGVVISGVDPVDPIYSTNFNYNTGGITTPPIVGIPDLDCLVVNIVTSSTNNNGNTPTTTWPAPWRKGITESGGQRQGGSFATYYPGDVPDTLQSEHFGLTVTSTTTANHAHPHASAVLVVQGDFL